MSAVSSILQNNLFFPLLLTVGAYLGAVWLQKKTGLALLNPILVSVIVILPVVLLLGIPIETYQEGTNVLSYLLTPATICLGLSLYEQLQKLKDDLCAILLGVLAGTVASAVAVLGICLLFRLDRQMIVTLLPKSVTTAIGAVLSEEAGGVTAITAAVIILTGLLGNVLGDLLCRLFRIRDPIARGVAYGTASHVVGTSKAIKESPLTGAVSSLSLAVSGLLTAVLFPIAVSFLK